MNIDFNKYNTIPKLFWRQVQKFPEKNDDLAQTGRSVEILKLE